MHSSHLFILSSPPIHPTSPPISSMRIRKRPPPPQIPLDPSPQLQATHKREELLDERARGVQLKGDLCKDLRGWGEKRDPNTTHPHPPTKITCPLPRLNGRYSPPLNATDHDMLVLKEEERDLLEKTWDDAKDDSNYKRNQVTTNGGECDDDKPVRKACKLSAVAATALLKRTTSISISENAEGKKRRSPTVTTEGSRCSRVNGRGWRCSQQTMVGYALCEHHLGKGRLRSVRGLQAGAGGSSKLHVVEVEEEEEEEERTVAEMGKKMIGMVKARSISSLINESSRVPTVDDYNASIPG